MTVSATPRNLSPSMDMSPATQALSRPQGQLQPAPVDQGNAARAQARVQPEPGRAAVDMQRSAFSSSAAPTALPVDLAGGAQVQGPLELQSAQAQQAIQKTLAYLGQAMVDGDRRSLLADPASSFSPRSVERDELGMTHVRMDRRHEGIPVFGEQVIGHLDRNGELRDLTGELQPIPAGLGQEPVQLSSAQALELARKAFNGATDRDRPPTAERVVFQDSEGNYRAAYHVQLDNIYELKGEDRPRRMNYLIDANSGELLLQYNQLGGIELPHDHEQEHGVEGHLHTAVVDEAPAEPSLPAEPVKVSVSTSPRMDIADLSRVNSNLDVLENLDIDKVVLDLDISHPHRGDLIVKLISPSGKLHRVHNRWGGGADDLKGPIDLTSVFKGEPSQGMWQIIVEDKSMRDQGRFNSWGLTIEGKPRKPDPTPAPQPGPADDSSLYSGQVDLSTRQNADGTYSLEDSTRGKGVVTYDANNQDRGTGTTPFTDGNNVWGEATDNPRNRAAVDAHYGAQMTYDFYKEVLGRNSIDGRGESLKSYVHIGTNYVNAFWDGQQMSYGDGDGRTAGPLTTLDIAGHEITHGLTERTAGLIYAGESGGLNEAFSDILGTGVEWYASQKNSSVSFDWSIGEDAWTPGKDGDALRYMDDPTRDNYSIDNYKDYPRQTEVHGSSGIANNAFYLLVNGGTNRTSGVEVQDGIGMDKGLKIFHRALANYMTPRTTFAQAREATLRAATDLYGADSVEVQKVKESWTAVGVG